MTYYISPTGSNTTGDGSYAAPWATLSHAFAVIGGGHTLVLKSGTYTKTAGSADYNDIPSNSTIRSEGGLGSVTLIDVVEFQIPTNYVTVDGLVFSTTPGSHPYDAGAAIGIAGNYNIFTNCRVQTGNITVIGNYNQITHNKVYAGDMQYSFQIGANREGPSNKGNIVRWNEFYDARATTVVFDEYPNGKAWGTVSAKSDNTITISVIGTETPSGHEDDDPPVGALLGEYSVGRHCMVLSGAAAGNYYEIISQSDATITLDTSTFSASGITIGDYVSVSVAQVENIVSDNYLGTTSPDYMLAAFCIFVSSVGNTFENNTVDLPAGLSLVYAGRVAVQDSGLGLYNSQGNSFRPNFRNKWRGNTFNFASPVSPDAQFCLNTYAYTSDEGPPVPTSATPVPYFSYYIEFSGNTINAATKVKAYVQDVKQVTWSHNGDNVTFTDQFTPNLTTYAAFDTLDPGDTSTSSVMLSAAASGGAVPLTASSLVFTLAQISPAASAGAASVLSAATSGFASASISPAAAAGAASSLAAASSTFAAASISPGASSGAASAFSASSASFTTPQTCPAPAAGSVSPLSAVSRQQVSSGRIRDGNGNPVRTYVYTPSGLQEFTIQ